MKYKKYISLGIGVAASFAVIVFVISYNGKSETSKIDSLSLDFTYDEANSVVKQSLQSQGITMSSSLRFLKQQDIEKWCKFFSDPEKQKLVEYCTSTEIKDPSGNFLGNIHMVGSPDAPKLVLVVLQSNPVLDNMNQIKTVFGTVTKNSCVIVGKILNLMDMKQLKIGSTLCVIFISMEANPTANQNPSHLHQNTCKFS